MKTKTIIPYVLATFLLVALSFNCFAVTTTLHGLYGNYSTTDFGTIVVNRNDGNNLVLSQLKAASFSYEANINIPEGDRVSFVFGYTGAGFYGAELCKKGESLVGLKVFRDGDFSGILVENIETEVTDINQIHFKIEVTTEGQLTLYVDGKQLHQLTISNYQVGYLGVVTYKSKAELSDILVDLGGEEGTLVPLTGLAGNFTANQPVFIINKKNNADNFVLSPSEASALTISGALKILEGDRMSFVFGHKSGNNWHAAEIRVVSESMVNIKAFKVGTNGGDLFNEEVAVNTLLPLQYKVDIASDGKLIISLNGAVVKEAGFTNYEGGRWGMLTWNSRAEVADFTVEIKDKSVNSRVSQDELSYLSGIDNAYYKSDVTYSINKANGNNFVSSTVAASAFSYEAKIKIQEGDRMSLVFGSLGNLNGRWFGTELRVVNNSRVAVKSFREGSGALFDQEFDADTSQPVLFKIEMTAAGQLTVYLQGKQVKQANFTNYEAGRLGFLTYNSKALVSEAKVIVNDQLVSDGFSTNTEGWSSDPGTGGYWRITPEGLRGTGNGNSPYFSSTSAADFVLEADMKYLSGAKAGGLLFRANEDHSVFYTIDVMNDDRQGVRILKFYKDKVTGAMSDITLAGKEGNLKDKPGYVRKENFNLKVEAIKSYISVYVDNNLIATASDSESPEGDFGVTNFNSEVLFQNIYFTPVTTSPLLTDLNCDVQLYPEYSTSVFSYNAVVPFTTTQLTLSPVAGESFNLFVNNQPVSSGANVTIELAEGQNEINVKVQDKESGVSTITVLHVKRRQNPEEAYLEKYRPQFHFTPEANWVNDPNGMVYYEGEYHLFYQYHPYSKQWGPMHWGHAISSDMVHWEEYPIALYPDKFGTMFSGSAVVDVNNTSGFFTNTPEKKGLVAIYTSAGATQQQSIAYSTDKGRTWIKYKEGEPVIKTADDPLAHGDFRDPKVFWHEESAKWMMVIAGGPLRFYSSPDLINWTYESGYKVDQTINGKAVSNIHTECPDFFKLPVSGETTSKWVLTGSGKFYMTGDFSEVDGKWYFIPDSNTRFAMNFGHDNYAAQTYSDMPENRRVMVNWMTNFDYAGDLAKITDPYNGTFTMAYELSLKRSDRGIRLYQNPVAEYQSLRKTPYSFNNVQVSATSENIFKDIRSNQFEIVAEITPEAGNTQVGFNLCSGNGQLTKVYYNTTSEQLVVDRVLSGASPNTNFPRVYSKAVKLIEGKLKLQLFVDWSNIEVFANNGESVASLLIFPDPESQAMEFYVKGEGALVNMEVYPLKSIWREEKETALPDYPADNEFGIGVYSLNNDLLLEVPVISTGVKLDVFNLQGKNVCSRTLASGTNRVSLSQGMFLLRYSNEDGSAISKVIIR